MIKDLALSAAAAFFLVSVLIPLLLSLRATGIALDHPNQRSLHDSPVPRTGGIAVLAGILASAMFFPRYAGLAPMAAGALLLFVTGLVDDMNGLPPLSRMVAQLMAGALFIAPLPLAQASAVLGVALLITLIWMTNLYNFMDGSDGLAAGMTVIGFGTYAAGAVLSGDLQMAALCTAIAAAAAAFLMRNFHPAKIFLGDSGSVPLGFLSAAIGILGVERGHWSLVFLLLVFAPFIADASLTLVQRLLRRQRVWEAHREHYYQRLIRMGLGHRRMAFIGYALMALAAASAMATRTRPMIIQIETLAAWAVGMLAFAQVVDIRWRRHAESAKEK